MRDPAGAQALEDEAVLVCVAVDEVELVTLLLRDRRGSLTVVINGISPGRAEPAGTEGGEDGGLRALRSSRVVTCGKIPD